MFQSIVVRNKFESLKPKVISALDTLNNWEIEEAKITYEELLKEVISTKENNTSKVEQILNEYYVLQSYICFFNEYCKTWQLIFDKKFGASWDSLQGAIGHFRDVKKFAYATNFRYIEFFEDQILSLEKLYPYRVFFSMGAIVDYFECSLCGLDIDSIVCEHRKGELYHGEVAVGIARNIERLDHVSLVTNPADKRCVPQYDDDGIQFNILRYLAELLINKKLRPLYFGELEHSTEEIENPGYIKKGRNEICYCGSGLKFKKCCIDDKTVEGGHIQIISNPDSAEAIMA